MGEPWTRLIAEAGTSQTAPNSPEPDMKSKMTTAFIQYGLAGAAALALTFPTPQAAKDAFTDTFLPRPPMSVEGIPGDRVLITSEDIVPTVVAYDPVAECMIESDLVPLDRLGYCTEILWESIAVYDTAYISVGGDFVVPGRGPTAHHAEDQRRALVKLCRTLWMAGEGEVQAIENPACAYAISGVEQRG